MTLEGLHDFSSGDTKKASDKENKISDCFRRGKDKAQGT